ncbi:MAG: FHA domain-containing protein [Planctomycetia bacterium]|nr:FHA domain-containing protein [Planctomycetia bacterium]
MPSLRIEIAGQVVHARLGDAPVRVGREAGCDLRIDAPDVSAVHLTIEPLPGGGHKLSDLNTGRPTKVNGLVVKRVALKPNDRIEVGPARITYLADGAVAAAPAPALAPARAPAAPAATRPAVAPARPFVERPVAPRAAAPAARAEGPAGATAPAAAPAPSRTPAPSAAASASPSIPTPSALVAEPAEAPATAPSRAAPSPRGSRGRLVGALIVTAVFAVAALGLAFLIRNRGGETGASLATLKAQLDAAVAKSADDVDGALVDLDRLATSPVEGIRRNAVREADYLRTRLKNAAAEVADLEKRAANLPAERIAAELDLLRSRHGAGVLARHADALERMEGARRGRLAQRADDATQGADALAAEGRFADALERWDRFVADSPGDAAANALAMDGRAAVDAKALEAFKALAAEAEAVVAKSGPRAGAMLLRERLSRFAGTSAAGAVARRAADYDHDAVAASAAGASSAVATGPKPNGSSPAVPRPMPGPGPGPAPATPPAPAVPSPSAVDRARVAALLTDADAHAAGRRFREALASLASATAIVEGTADAPRVAARREDLELAKAGLALLCATVKAHPERFVAVEIAPQYPASLVDADEEYLTAAVRGGRTKVRWTAFDAPRTALIVEAAALPAKDALPVAALLREVGAKEACERLLLHAVEGGGDKGAIDLRLARWRGEPVPAGGYVPYEGRLVAPAERDRLVREARVAAACARVGSRDAKERKAAYEELLSLGAPAREAFVTALRARREAAAKEVAAAKVFSSGRTKQRLVEELQKRRTAALALIDDAQAYPYPYAPNQAEIQARVDALVDQVREVWERPFDLVATWDRGVEEALTLVREVDEVLGKVEEGWVGDLEAVKAIVNQAIDVPGLVAEPYDRDVLAFNEKVATSATGQEKENVRLVNAYRIMMGRQAVKLEERLTRAARGHSIEMRDLNYFAHESPTPGKESPGKRCAIEGYSGGSENIAFGSGFMNAKGAFDGWYHSSGHHRNMLGRGWTELGVGRASRTSDTASYWTQNFGAMGGKSLKTPDALPPIRPEVAPERDPEDAAAAAAGDGRDPEAPAPPGPAPKDG